MLAVLVYQRQPNRSFPRNGVGMGDCPASAEGFGDAIAPPHNPMADTILAWIGDSSQREGVGLANSRAATAGEGDYR